MQSRSSEDIDQSDKRDVLKKLPRVEYFPCAHLSFIFVKVLGLDFRESLLPYQAELQDEELRSLFWRYTETQTRLKDREKESLRFGSILRCSHSVCFCFMVVCVFYIRHAYACLVQRRDIRHGIIHNKTYCYIMHLQQNLTLTLILMLIRTQFIRTIYSATSNNRHIHIPTAPAFFVILFHFCYTGIPSHLPADADWWLLTPGTWEWEWLQYPPICYSP